MLESKLTLNPGCMVDEQGTWKYVLAQPGLNKSPMVRINNETTHQKAEGLTFNRLLSYTLTAITLGLITIAAWNTYQEIGKMPEQQEERFIRPPRQLENYHLREEQPRKVMV